MYSPKISEELVRSIYQMAKPSGLAMTQYTDKLVAQGIAMDVSTPGFRELASSICWSSFDIGGGRRNGDMEYLGESMETMLKRPATPFFSLDEVRKWRELVSVGLGSSYALQTERRVMERSSAGLLGMRYTAIARALDTIALDAMKDVASFSEEVG